MTEFVWTLITITLVSIVCLYFGKNAGHYEACKSVYSQQLKDTPGSKVEWVDKKCVFYAPQVKKEADQK